MKVFAAAVIAVLLLMPAVAQAYQTNQFYQPEDVYCRQVASLLSDRANSIATARLNGNPRWMTDAYARIDINDEVPVYNSLYVDDPAQFRVDIINQTLLEIQDLAYEIAMTGFNVNSFTLRVRNEVYSGCMAGFIRSRR